MAARGIDVLAAAEPANIHWLCGYDGWSFYVPQWLLVFADAPPLWFGRAMDAAGARRTIRAADCEILGYDDSFIHNPPRHAAAALAGLLVEKGHQKSAVGVEMDAPYFTAAAMRTLAREMPAAHFIDADTLVNRRRSVKSAAEIEYMRRAARIVEAAHRRILEIMEPGLPKNILAAEINRVLTAGVGGIGGDYPAIVPMLPSGADAGAPHLTWDEKPLVAGEGTFFEIAGCFRRYHCPLARTVYLGRPPQKWRDAERALQEALDAALIAAHPDATCESVARAVKTALAARGFDKPGRCGYSIGVGYPPDWGERTFSLREGDRTTLRPGMCLHIMPGLWLDGWGVEITESIVVADGGAETLANYPRRLFVK